MPDTTQEQRKGIAKAFQDALNKHGFSFQYSVLKKVEQLFKQKKSFWVFEAAEFPVAVRGRNTHIDFVLTLARDRRGNFKLHPQTPVYLVAECKRANPALNRWCFARAPYVNRGDRIYSIVEHVGANWREDPTRVRSGGSVARGLWTESYQIGLEIKSSERGDTSGDARGAINRATTQACEALNGMVEYLAREFMRAGKVHSQSAFIIPVIFTTAKLFTTTVDISDADLSTGNVEIPVSSLEEKPWICLQHHGSVDLKHEIEPLGNSSYLTDVMNAEYIRTIPIVSAAGIERFFTEFDFELDDLKDCP